MVIKIAKKYFPDTPECQVSVKQKNDGPIPIKLGDLAGVFVLYAIGGALSIFIFVSEILLRKFARKIPVVI